MYCKKAYMKSCVNITSRLFHMITLPNVLTILNVLSIIKNKDYYTNKNKERDTMKKKIMAIFIATVMTTSLVACGGGNGTADTKQEKPKTSVAATDKKDDKKDDTGKEDSKKKETEKAEAEKESDEKSETAEKANATETADKKDSKETSNKAEANKSDKDKGSANNSNSSVSKPSNSGNANNNGSASKPSTPAKPNKPSGNNSGSSNNGNHNGSVNKPSKPAKPNKPVEQPSEPSKPVEKPVEKPSEKPSEPQKPAPHVCNFNIWKDEVNHTEMVTETYTEQVPKYKWVAYDECRKCGFQSSDPDVMDAHCLDCDSTYTTKKKQVQDGFETVTKTRQVPKTVVDDPAHYECSCGKRK